MNISRIGRSLRFTAVLLVVVFIFSPFAPVFAQVVDKPIATDTPATDTVPDTTNNPRPDATPDISAPTPATPDSSSGPSDNTNPVFTNPDTGNDNPTDTMPDTKSDESKAKDRKSMPIDNQAPGAQNNSVTSGGSGNLYPTQISSGSATSIIPQTDPSTGALVYSYPINTPPGRNGIQPELALQYNSQDSTANTILGYGWNVNIPYIQRLNKTGADQLYSSTNFTSSLSGELVFTSGSSYQSKIEEGSFLKYTFSSNTWTVTDKKGNVYTFGSTASTRQDDPSDSTKIYKWMLEKIQDTNGNFVSYTYFKDNGQIYPSTIVYTSNGANTGIFEVDFLRQSRSDSIQSYTSAFLATTNYRINEIDVKTSGTITRKYSLTYVTAENAVRSMLGSITESGTDESTLVTTTLPAITFTNKTNSSTNWGNINWSLPGNGLDYIGETVVGDVNGDGLPDILQSFEDTTGSYTKHTYLNNGDGTWTSSTAFLAPFPFVNMLGGPFRNLGAISIDINGDGLSDLIEGDNGAVWLSTGSGWASSTTYGVIDLVDPVFYSDTGIRIADLNGDGLPDQFKAEPDGHGVIIANVYLNTGSGFSSDVGSSWTFPTYNIWGGTNYVDVNGDGITDVIQILCNGTCVQHAWLGNGKGAFTSSTSYTPTFNLSYFGSTSIADPGIRFADINGDGLLDMVQSVNWAGVHTATFINTGTGWSSTSSWTSPYIFSGGTFQQSMIMDFNGDGLPDIANSTNIELNNGTKTDLVSNIGLSQGGSAAITYKATALYRDTLGNLLNPNLPLANQTVSQISLDDGNGNQSPVTYIYSNGSYYYNASSPTDRRFAGFNTINKTDAAGNITKVYYHQGNSSDSGHGEYSDDYHKIGKIYRIENYDNASNLYAKTINKWDEYDLGNGSKFVKLAQSVDSTYDGDSTHKDKATAITYSNTNGNITQKIDYGQATGSDDGSFTDIGTDDFTTAYAYATNGSNIVGLPDDVTVTDHNATKVKEDRFYYDTQGLGSVIKGNETKHEMWKSGSVYTNTQKTYSSTYGTVATATDQRGKVTTYTNDTYNLYPATVTNPLTQSTQFTYDYSSGQVTQKTDPNTRVFQWTYDGLDRLLTEKQPDLTTPSTLVTKASYVYTDTSGAVSVHKTDNLDASTARETYDYFDGLGRLIQERKEAEGANYEVTDKVYNNRGLLDKESLPYFSSGSTKTSPTATGTLYTSYTYDPLGRIVTTTNALGTTTNTYNDWKLTVTDANSKTKDLYKDAYGNLVQVDEHLNGSLGLTNNLLSYWKLDESSGNASDSYGSRTLTNNNTTPFAAAKINNGIDFGTTNTNKSFDYTSSNIYNGGPFTVNLWVKIRTAPASGENQLFFVSVDSSSSTFPFISYKNSGGTLQTNMGRSRFNVADDAVVANVDLGTSAFKMLTVTYDGTNLHSYVNGSEVGTGGTSTGNGTGAPTYTRMGGWITGGDWAKAYEDEVGFWGRALSSTEVSNLYNSGNGLAYSSFTGGSGTTYSTYYTYDYLSDLTKITDALGNIRNFTYDGLGRRLTAQDLHASADSTFGSWTYTYDDAGNLTQTVDPKGQTVNYTYDDINRKLTEDYTGQTGTEVTNTYDAGTDGKGHLTHVVTGSLDQTNTYNPLGGLKSESKIISSTTYLTTYDYNRQGNQINLTNPDNSQVKYNYNSAGLLDSVQRKESTDGSFINVVTNFDYSPTEQTTTINYANGSTTTNTYDATKLYRLSNKVTTISGGSHAQDLAYTYDNVGNITQILDASATSTAKTAIYAYDDLYRLTSATITNVASGQTPYTQTYTYDAIGNLLTKSDGAGTYSYTGNTGTNYANPHAVTSIGSNTYSYDNNGNLVSSSGGSAPAWYNTGGTWTTRKQLTIDHTKVSGTSNLTNFPILVSVTDADLKTTANGGHVGKSDGTDILFTSSDGTTKLSHEIEKYDGTTGTLIAWVKVPTLAYATDTNLIVYYGNASASDQQDKNNVWDSNYKMVQHLPNGSTLSANDSTANTNNGTINGATASAAQINGGANFNGTSNYIGLPNNLAKTDTSGTIEAWVKFNGTGANTTSPIVSLGGTASGNYVFALRRWEGAGNTNTLELRTYPTVNNDIFSTNTLSNGTWYHVAITGNGSTYKMYINGNNETLVVGLGSNNGSWVGSQSYGQNTIADIARLWFNGATFSSSNATIDEVRLSNTARSSDWIKTEYNNQNSPSTFMSLGTVSSGGGTTTNTWDYNNRLTGSTNGTYTDSYVYDPSGQRIKAVTSSGTTTYATQAYNTDGTTATKHIFANGAEISTVTGTGASAAVHYTATDHISGSNITTNASDALEETLDYYPYGLMRFDQKTGSYGDQRKFTGQEYDVDTGLYYYNARYYDSAIGRFASQDPIFLLAGASNFSSRWDINWRDIKPGQFSFLSQSITDPNKLALIEYLSNPQHLNSYSYVINNPIKYTDPTGEKEYHVSFDSNFGLGGEFGNSWTIGFATDGTFGISTTLHGGGLAGVDASVGVSAGYSTANTWSDTLGSGQYVTVGGKVLYGGGVTANFSDGKYTGTDVGVGVGVRGLPPVPVTLSGGANKTVPVVQGSVSGLKNSVTNTVSKIVDATSKAVNATVNTVQQGWQKTTGFFKGLWK